MKPALAVSILVALLNSTALADEASDRDPTAWPPALRQSLASTRAPSAPSANEGPAPIRHLVRRDGKAYVVVGTRHYAVGELLDGARIERIDEQAVWLMEGGRVRREPLFAGVEKRPPFDDRSAKNSKEKP